MSKAGPCRIPTFGSRIPQIHSKTKSCEISNKQIGKRVRIGEKEGILKFVGNVHFSKGVWCGVELTNSTGKNDGIVNGVRYFACADRRGLMAPQSKVSLLTTGSCESLNDDVSSGPYSMLFIEPKLDDTFISNENGIGNILEQQNDATERESLNSRKEFSNPDRNKANETFIGNQNAFLDNTCTYEILDKQNSSNSSDEFNDTIIETRLDDTFNAKQHLNFTLNVNETISQEATNIYSPQKGASSQLCCEKRAYEDNTTYNYGRRRAFDLKPLNDTTNVSKNYPTFDFEKSKKRSSKVFDISLDDVNTTIINSANSLSPSVEVKAFATNQTETPLIERNLNYLPINKSCESLLSGSSVEVKRRRTSNPKTQKVEAIILKNLPNSVDKPSSLPQLRNSFNASSPPRSAPALNKLTHSTPNRGEFTDALLRKLRISSVGSSGASDKNTNYDDDSSKRNSLEFEESLGILTPDQMIDGTIFTNVQSRSPSLEYDGNVNEFDSKAQENCSKSELPSPRDSSLGILDESIAMKNCLGLTLEVTTNKEVKETELQSPNLTSMTDCSLGILDAQVISNLTLKTDTTVNMELPLDSIDKSKDFKFTRLEQTPSPEELPLDPTPVVESDSKTEPSKSKTTNNSFITSITSITSLDTGYQGDGEMSRPASRGPDNSPLTRRPLPRPQPRRPDPMTDSDFYTESDADNHEDNQLRGDRRAQVIDGTLYGVDPQAAADIYVNNRENMDSSGIFTDLENNTRNEEDMPNEVPDVSPSDASTKTISENSQNNLQEVLEKKSSKQDNKDIDKTVQKENPKKRNAPSPVVSNPSNVSSPRHRAKEENAAKKYKMPKRDVASKVKAMLEPSLLQQNEKKSAKKPVGRWDAVMKKISTNEQTKTNLKEVKSKVFDNVNVKKMGVQRTNERKPNTRSPGNPKSPSSKTLTIISNALEGTTKSASRRNFLSPSSAVLNKRSPEYKNQLTPKEKHGVKQWMPKSEPRRIRNRTSASSTPKNIGSNVESSIHSSLSDLSAGTIPPKKIVGPAKKRDVVQVTQVLTANKLSPRNQQQQTALENKKNSSLHPSSSNESKASRTIFSPKDKKQAAAKECGRGTVKGGRTSPSVRPPTQARVPTKQVPRVAEALAVLVQHLVFNVEAYQVPRLKRQVEKFHIETDELRLACRELEEKLHGERIEQTRLLEEERKRCQNDIDDLIDKHRDQLTELNNRHDELEQYLRAEKEQAEQNLCKQHEDQLITLKKEFDKLQRTHEESLDILREENNAIREQIDEKQLEVEKAKHESMKLKKDYENKEILFKEHNHKLEQQVSQLKSDLEDRIKNLIEENKRLRDENDRLLSYGDDKEIGLQEVQSLRAVLELKQKEVGELRKALAEATQKAEVLVGAEEKAKFLKAKCEDLQLQIQRKSEYEQGLLQENQRLKDSFKEESNQKKRLSQHNEELKWKLKQNKEVISKVLEQTGDTASFNRSLLSSSFNEKHSSSKLNLERTLSFRERTYSNKSNISVEDSIRSRKSKNSLEFDVEDLSPPSSPKVKGVVEKSDSVSYVLDLDESPDVVASRIVRRSFRNTTPPKNTPTKSPCNKRPRIRMSLSQSASSSAIITSNRNEFDRPKSASVRNGECDNDNVFIWTSSISSSPKNLCDKFDESCESSNSSMKLEDHLDLDEDHDVDIQLPALPSELDRQRARPLPSPKHLAGESMVSESNSEDESTSSSQL